MNNEAEFSPGISGDQPGQGVNDGRNGGLDTKESSQGETSFPRENKAKCGCGRVDDSSGLMDGSNP